MARYIVTYDVPVYVSVEANDEDEALGIARDYWKEQETYKALESGLEPTSWYVGEPYDDEDVSKDESGVQE
jgi:hypothetical protein